MYKGIIILGTLVVVFLVGMAMAVISTIRSAVKPEKYRNDRYEALDDEVAEAEAYTIGAVVLSKHMTGYWSGSAKSPHYNECYLVTFLTDEGDKREYSVGKKTFEGVYEGQASTLVIVDGEFFAFEDGEEITDEE